MMQDIIKFRPEYQFESLMANLSISNELVQKVKSAQESEKWLHRLFTSEAPILIDEDGVIDLNGRLCVPKYSRMIRESFA